MILANGLLGIAFAAANLIYAHFGNTSPHETTWTPLWLTFFNAEYVKTIGPDFGLTVPNFSFYFFLALLLVNVFFLIKLGRANRQA